MSLPSTPHLPKPPTLEDVGRVAGVSRATASRVIRGEGNVSPDARRAVDKAVLKLGYVPSQAARSLVTRRTNTFAIIIAEPVSRVFRDPFFEVVIESVGEILAPEGIQLIVLPRLQHQSMDSIIDYVTTGHIDGGIVVSHHDSEALNGFYARHHVPIVFIGRPWESTGPVPYVDVDNVQGAVLATQHLIDVGCEHIGTITGGMDMPVGIDRLQGWRTTLQRHGLDAHRVMYGDFTMEAGYKLALQLLDEHPDTDGIFIASDLMASGAYHAFREQGLVVGRDIKVVGYDNGILATTLEPPLTTVNNPIAHLAQAATRKVLAAMHGNGPMHKATYPVSLVVRQSA